MVRQAFLISILCCLPACWQEQKKEGLFVINVLNTAHFNDCHIKGSLHVTLDKLDNFAKGLDKEKAEIVVYCSNYMCTASGFAAKKLRQLGFEHVWSYEAGMAEWKQAGLPIEGPCQKAYLEKQLIKPELEQTEDISIISTDELARKMGL